MTDTLRVPEIAFTGDTSGGFLELGAEHDVFRARLLIMELTFLDAQVSVAEAQVRDVANNCAGGASPHVHPTTLCARTEISPPFSLSILFFPLFYFSLFRICMSSCFCCSECVPIPYPYGLFYMFPYTSSLLGMFVGCHHVMHYLVLRNAWVPQKLQKSDLSLSCDSCSPGSPSP